MKFTSATVALLAGNQVVASNHLGNRLIRHPRQIGEIRRFRIVKTRFNFNQKNHLIKYIYKKKHCLSEFELIRSDTLN